ncbi:hypothetical protein JQ616_22295 [Bradyrhizobium tropiciagri]|uniref:hypothetical protein n=1 Tax=Bradyrhizobium tropiciagri TaxID=312253 RepID=UPI001BA8C2F2|nr:hypothetical protein [Bradyrhizobium tropiciagri]MBR0897691.1 hypothetical protein [Bradyrhizobium tropiciagri]
MKKTLQECLKTIEAVRRAERTALRVAIGIGADVASTPWTIRMGAMRSRLAVIFRADEFSDQTRSGGECVAATICDPALAARPDVKVGLQAQ